MQFPVYAISSSRAVAWARVAHAIIEARVDGFMVPVDENLKREGVLPTYITFITARFGPCLTPRISTNKRAVMHSYGHTKQKPSMFSATLEKTSHRMDLECCG